ncbi:uncharacterized protein [Drosophila pseudoobscura]|uniref:Uncharacterized protein n=1 Tax=Drosophila pseudoobscura pseudoobscura TaxID=46245 RepID=A0A6I8VUT2_DROPS|nr:uncharacterized protein LOC117183766 [Drosophila pseudoobscura]
MESLSNVSYSMVESTTAMTHWPVESTTAMIHWPVESDWDGSYSFVDTSEWIPCEEGFAWSVEMGECQPVVEPRSYRTCPWGYKMNARYKQCMRVKYHGKQQWGTIRKWWHNLLNPPVPRKPPRKIPPTKATTAYTGEWWGYNRGYGKDVPRP